MEGDPTHRIIVCICAFLLTALGAEARERRAFVVGVADYTELTDLKKTLSDADGYASVFGDDLEFVVTRVPDNPTRHEFDAAFGAFLQSIAPGDEVAFVFSGHGWSDGAENYIALADAPKNASEFELKQRTLPVGKVILSELRKRQARLVIAIFDACRDNPFDTGTMSGFEKGLARVDQIDGMLIVNSAGPNQKALDRLSEDDPAPYSVFTRALLPKLKDPDLPLMNAFSAAREEVSLMANSINHRQRPMISTDLPMEFCFSGNCTGALPPPLDADTALFLQVVKGEKGRDPCRGYGSYLTSFPGGLFRDRVQKLFDLTCTSTLSVTDQVSTRTVVDLATDLPPEPLEAFDTFKDCEDCPQMMVLPAGTFQMGSAPYEHSEKEDPGYPQRQVTVKGFAIGTTEVTFAQYQMCQMEGGCSERLIDDRTFGKGNRPIMNVTWDEAKAYTRWLTQMSGAYTYRLPTEAEWEYAARGGKDGMIYCWDGPELDACLHGNLLDLSSKAKYGWRAESHPVR